MFRSILLAVCSIAMASVGAAEAAFERKVALIVGNGAYQNAPSLANPVRDARAMAKQFAELGFTVVEGYDVDRAALQSTLRDFSREARNADLSVFFYAGHGIAYEGRNYMIPVDAAFSDATALDFEALPVDFVTKQMGYADAVSLVFLDACRDNPLAGSLARSLGLQTRGGAMRGLAQMDVKGAGKGLAIAFATSPGEVAYDGDGAHSPFTAALLKHIATPQTDFAEIMSRVTGEVLQTTASRQRPWLNASLTGSVVLNPAPQAATPEPAAPQPVAEAGADARSLEAQTLLFDVAQKSGLPRDYKAYLARFPEGLYAYNARLALELLEDRQDVAAVRGPAVADSAPSGLTLSPLPQKGAEETGASEADETALGLSRSARRAVQDRLNLADAPVGVADGIFGPKTRGGIAKWQEGAGFVASGYLDAAQLKALESATETQYAALTKERAAAQRAAAARAAKAKAARTKARATRSANAKQKATTRKRTSASKATAKRRAQPTKRAKATRPQTVQRVTRVPQTQARTRAKSNTRQALRWSLGVNSKRGVGFSVGGGY